MGHGFSIFLSWKSYGKSMLKKRGHPAEITSGEAGSRNKWRRKIGEELADPPGKNTPRKPADTLM